MATDGKKLVRSKSGLRIVSISQNTGSPFSIPEPLWIPDNECSECMNCHGKFAFTRRRHHCRRCGKCFCNKCCEKQLPLPRMCFVDPVRQCDQCFQISTRENDFFEKHIKNLTYGACFLITGVGIDHGTMQHIYNCKLSADQRQLQFLSDENSESIDPVDMTSIDGVQIITSGTDTQGNTVATAISIRFKDSHGEMIEMRLTASEGTAKRQGMAWIASMQKAMKMLYDSRNQRS